MHTKNAFDQPFETPDGGAGHPGEGGPAIAQRIRDEGIGEHIRISAGLGRGVELAVGHNFFEQAHEISYVGIDGLTREESETQGHGRRERRSVCVINSLEWLPQRETWGIESAIEICSERMIKEKVEQATRYYVSSRKSTANQFAEWIRDHWSIENGLHYIMDVVFLEDASLSDVGHSAENMALIRRLAANVVKTFDPKRGMADARRNATYEPLYLTGLLGKLFMPQKS